MRRFHDDPQRLERGRSTLGDNACCWLKPWPSTWALSNHPCSGGPVPTIALGCIASLTALLLGKIKLDFLANPKGHLGVGICAGIATGLASVGGMVVALFVLVSNVPARQMRATLVVFLLLSQALTLIILIAYGVMDQRAALRGVTLAVPATLGVYLGKKFFISKLEPFYRPFCLLLLIGLALMGLVRMGI